MRVAVVGAGVAGMACAWYLARAGHQVTVVDRNALAGAGASFANGAQLSYSYVAPLAAPGVAAKAAKWMLDAEGPLRLRPQADTRQWRWLLGFLRACNAATFARTTEELLGLAHYSRALMQELVPEAGLEFAWRRNGKLVVYRDPRELAGAAAVVAMQARFGAEQQVLDAAQCVAAEPALAHVGPLLAGGILTPSEEVGDAHRFCLELRRVLAERFGAELLAGVGVQGLWLEGGRVAGLRTEGGDIAADAVVLSAGTAAVKLLAPLGLDLPIYPLKGYSLTVPVQPGHQPPRISVTDAHHKVVYALLESPGETRLRVAGMVDLVGEDDSIAANRIATVQRQAAETFPEAADWPAARTWAGLRPATPDGKPILGESGIAGLWLNLGHGGLGFTLSAATGRLVADLVSGAAPALSLAPFALKRS